MPVIAPISSQNTFKPRPASASDLASRVNYFYAASDASSPEMAPAYANCNPAGISRRSSASFKHVATNSLVSNSPFVRPKTDGLGIRYSASQENIESEHHSRSPFKQAVQQSPKSALATRRRVSGPRAGKFAKHAKEVKFGYDQVKEFETEAEETEDSVYSVHEPVSLPLRKLPSPFGDPSNSASASASTIASASATATTQSTSSVHVPEQQQELDVLVRDILADCPLSPPTHTSLPVHKKSPNWRLSTGGTTLIDAGDNIGPLIQPQPVSTLTALKTVESHYVLPEVKSVSVFSPTTTIHKTDSDNISHNSFSALPSEHPTSAEKPPRSLPQPPVTKSHPKETVVPDQPFILPPIDDFGAASFMPTPTIPQSGSSSPNPDSGSHSLVGRQRINRATVLARVKAELGAVPSHVPSSESFSTSTLIGIPGSPLDDLFNTPASVNSGLLKNEATRSALPSTVEEPILPSMEEEILHADSESQLDLSRKSSSPRVEQPHMQNSNVIIPVIKHVSPVKKSYFIDDGISSDEEEHELRLPTGGAREREEAIFAARRKSRIEQQPARRRSLSVGSTTAVSQPAADLDLATYAQPKTPTLEDDEDDDFGRDLGKEMGRILGNKGGKTYTLVERQEIKVSSPKLDSKVVNNSAGDVDQGRAWRTVRRPSDMNEYAAHMKEMRAKDKSPNAAGKVFVKVIGIQGLELPLPEHPTFFCCTLDNTIQCVATPYVALSKDSKILQEFDLIMNKSLQFTLDLKVRMDMHLRRNNVQSSPAPSTIPSRPMTPVEPKSSSTNGGFRAFFGSPKKKKEREMHHPPSPAPLQQMKQAPPSEPLLRYLTKEGSFGRARVVFSDISDMCQGKSVRLEIPLVGQKVTSTSPHPLPCVVGKILVQVFCLPSLVGVRQSALPSCLEDAEKAIRHGDWHRKRIIAGTLTQSGGDCATWKRRTLEIVGGRIIAYNDITKKPIAMIDLTKAIKVIDDQAPGATARDEDECEIYLQRSFRVLFKTAVENVEEEIAFFADTDSDKAMWLKALNALVGRIPEKHLWVQALFASQTQSKIPVRTESPVKSTKLPSRSRLDERPPPPAASSGTAMCSSAELAKRMR